jgi:hypothetical protein
VSWPQIGKAAGLSAGAARRRWGALDTPLPPGSPVAAERAVAEEAGVAVPALSAALVDLAADRAPWCPDCATGPPWRPCATHTRPLAISPAQGPDWALGAPVAVRPTGSRGLSGVVAAVVGWDPTLGRWVYRINVHTDPTGPAVPGWWDEISLRTRRP